MWFVRGGNRLDPISSSGVGAVDVAAFGLKVAMWSLAQPKKRNVLVLDEPFKHLRGTENQRRCSEMVTAISKEVGLQLILTSDVTFSIAADRVFDVIKQGSFSEVKVIE